ncbi:MAG: hypothetical protein GXY52_11405 [Chloroflexi bacterium]|nr:hypothetical protein [Chloroflexota bacterium]
MESIHPGGGDDEDNLYLTGYSGSWLFCVDPNGKTLVDFSVMPVEYEEHGFYWPSSLFVESDGMIHIRYYSNDMIMIIDPALGGGYPAGL